jgi:hypothetical protein
MTNGKHPTPKTAVKKKAARKAKAGEAKKSPAAKVMTKDVK